MGNGRDRNRWAGAERGLVENRTRRGEIEMPDPDRVRECRVLEPTYTSISRHFSAGVERGGRMNWYINRRLTYYIPQQDTWAGFIYA